MSGINYIDEAIDKKLLDMHTCYLAKVLSTNGTTAKIQPLGLTKELGKAAIAQSPLSNVPIAKTARYKITGTTSITYVSDVSAASVTKSAEGYVTSVTVTNSKKTVSIPQISQIAAGNIVVCVCGERDITEAKKGNNSVPPAGHHSMSDSVIIAVL